MSRRDPAERTRDRRRRRHIDDDSIAGYAIGPEGPRRATARALDRAGGARAIALVEGISDQIALETLAERRDRDLDAEGVVVVPVGGAQAFSTYLARFGPFGDGLPLAGLCDAAEQDVVRHGLASCGLGAADDRAAMERLGFFVCVEDLEDELIRAAGTARVEEVLAARGDLPAFRTMQRQPAWRSEPVEAQMRRFMGSGARRKARYARYLVQAVDRARIPHALEGVLTHLGTGDPAI